jgi:hypothetical protein
MWAGFALGAIAAISASFVVAPGMALLSAPITAILYTGGGALAGGTLGLAYGAIRHSRLFDHPQPEKDRLEDIAALHQRVQDSLIPEQALGAAPSLEQPPRRAFTQMIEREREAARLQGLQR